MSFLKKACVGTSGNVTRSTLSFSGIAQVVRIKAQLGEQAVNNCEKKAIATIGSIDLTVLENVSPSAFTWKVMQDRIPAKENMKKRGRSTDPEQLGQYGLHAITGGGSKLHLREEYGWRNRKILNTVEVDSPTKALEVIKVRSCAWIKANLLQNLPSPIWFKTPREEFSLDL
ncbi:hypothetical protein SLEP1_g35141 [Rubroshorea leprosula]|uniref:Uncharacterized protein n=1 Tax=Rubroshorea leprosula TaxID=152421 RepID=A0AAV5KMA9_9ROSI|nr:hypothetical protein SLEP1_g35141 [Rubroshorea leprosula]